MKKIFKIEFVFGLIIGSVILCSVRIVSTDKVIYSQYVIGFQS